MIRCSDYNNEQRFRKPLGEIPELPFSFFYTRNIVAVVASLPLPPAIEIKSELKPRLREIFKRGNSTIEQERAKEKKSSSKSNKEGVRRSDQTTATAPSEEGAI